VAERECCRKARELLLAHLDGRLRGPVCRELEAHLAGCPDCAACRERLGDLPLLCRQRRTPDPARREEMIRRILERIG
jgi:anti-sigma factor RsiW